MNRFSLRRYLRPARVFLIAVLIGLLLGLTLRFAARPVLRVLEQALYFRITKPLEIIQGPLSGIMGTEEAVTALYLLVNNIIVSFVAAFGGVALIRYTMDPGEESLRRTGRLTNAFYRLVGEGNPTYKEPSVLVFLLPLAVVFVNGLILGIFSVSQGLSWKEMSVYFAYILPHGIIELPAVVFAATIGYASAVQLKLRLDEGSIQGFFDHARELLTGWRTWRLFVLVIVMLVSAAFVEAYITPVLGRNALQRAYFSLEMLNSSVAEGEPAFLYLRAAFGSTIAFSGDSGEPLDVQLFGSDRFPFLVEGSRLPANRTALASRIQIPDEEAVLVLKFAAITPAPARIHAVAERGRLRDEASLVITTPSH